MQLHSQKIKEIPVANFVSGGMDTFRALAYGEQHQNNLDYMRNVVEYGTSTWNASADRFKESIRNTYDRYVSGDAQRRIKAARRQLKGMFSTNQYRYLRTIGDLQAPPKCMMGYLMAEPTIRRRYKEQRCDGYSGEFVDLYPNHDVKDNPLYRDVMNGIVVETEDGWEATSYAPEIFDEDDVELQFDEQVDIINSWETMASAVLRGEEDPTSRYNGSL